MDLSTLSEADRADFERRLGRLGIAAEAVEDAPLEVNAGESLRLEMAGESPISPMIFATKDLDTLRRWVGSPDRAVEKRVVQPFEPIIRGADFATDMIKEPVKAPKRRSISAKSAIARLSGTLSEVTKIEPKALLDNVARAKAEPQTFQLRSAEVDTLRAAARSYIHGDLKMVDEFKPAIEAYFGEFQIAVWLRRQIVVKRNSTLTLGTGVHNLTAFEVIIEPGGRVRSHGHLTVSATKIRRPPMINPGLVFPKHVLTLNTLNRDPIFP